MDRLFRRGDEWAVLKDIIRSELAPLHKDIDSVATQVSSLRDDLKDLRANTYDREMIDEKFRQANGQHDEIRRSVVELDTAFREHCQAQAEAPDKRLQRVSLWVASGIGVTGFIMALFDFILRIFGVM